MEWTVSGGWMRSLSEHCVEETRKPAREPEESALEIGERQAQRPEARGTVRHRDRQ